MVRGYIKREKAAHRESMYVAWHQAAFQRSRKMPALSVALGDKQEPKARSRDQMIQAFKDMQKSGISLSIRKVVD